MNDCVISRRKPNPSHGDTRQVEHRLLKKLAASERPDRYGHYETAAEYVAQREAMKGIGRALGTKMALRLQQLEQLQEPTEARRIQAQSKAFERVCDILSRHGYQISRWTRTEDLETRLKELDEALSSVVPTGTVDRETLYAISCLQQLRTTLGLQDRKEHDGKALDPNPVPRNATPEMLARWQEREIALAERQMGGGR